MLELKNEVVDKTLNLPTDFSEITAEMITNLSNQLTIKNGHVLVAVIPICPIVSLAMWDINSMNEHSQAVVVCAKDFKCEHSGLDLKVRDNLIIATGGIDRGHHINLNANQLDPTRVHAFIKTDDELFRNITNSTDLENVDVYMISFKVLPVHEIIGTIKPNK